MSKRHPPPSVEKTPTKEKEHKETIKETTTAPQKPVVVSFYDCLKDSPLSDDEKTQLNKFSEQDVQRAHSWVVATETKPKTSWIQLYKWACEKKPEMPKKEEDNIPINKKLAQKAERIKHVYKIEACLDCIEISHAQGGTAEIIEYNLNPKEFEQRLLRRLRIDKIA